MRFSTAVTSDVRRRAKVHVGEFVEQSDATPAEVPPSGALCCVLRSGSHSPAQNSSRRLWGQPCWRLTTSASRSRVSGFPSSASISCAAASSTNPRTLLSNFTQCLLMYGHDLWQLVDPPTNEADLALQAVAAPSPAVTLACPWQSRDASSSLADAEWDGPHGSLRPQEPPPGPRFRVGSRPRLSRSALQTSCRMVRRASRSSSAAAQGMPIDHCSSTAGCSSPTTPMAVQVRSPSAGAAAST